MQYHRHNVDSHASLHSLTFGIGKNEIETILAISNSTSISIHKSEKCCKRGNVVLGYIIEFYEWWFWTGIFNAFFFLCGLILFRTGWLFV
jgi:hypothetical protein